MNNQRMNNRGRNSDDDRVEELSFEDDGPPPRTGDLRIEPGQRDNEISPQRVRDAGLTGGELSRQTVGENLLTADDLSPETLFDENALDSDELVVADKELRIVEDYEIGGGTGLDEAELAQITGRPH